MAKGKGKGKQLASSEATSDGSALSSKKKNAIPSVAWAADGRALEWRLVGLMGERPEFRSIVAGRQNGEASLNYCDSYNSLNPACSTAHICQIKIQHL
jgi:hypothetical protein